MPYYQETKRDDLRKMQDRIQQAVYTPVGDLEITAWLTSEPVPYAKRRSGKKVDLAPGKKWGDLFDCAWFRFTGRVPDVAAQKHVVLLIDVNGEACVFDTKGNPVRGLTNINTAYDENLGKAVKRVLQFARRAKKNQRIDIWADAGCNDLFGNFKENGTVKEARIAVCNDAMRDLFFDYEVLLELMNQIPSDRARHQRLLFKLEEAAHCMNDFTESEAKAARAILAPELAKKNGDVSLELTAIGHAHMDLAWLWPIRETYRKGARTYSTVLELMDRYPDFIFGASQPQIYQWMKELYPALYRRIKNKVAEGRWEPQGGMWVEADTNVSGGEALVRQLLYGKRFFKDEFGWDVKNLWLPDVFGYTAALPQLLKKSGIDYFMTIKLSWNQFNTHPHHTFFWEGIDGSRVLTHLAPEGEYNSSAAPRAIAGIEKKFLDKGVSDRCLMPFGIGDGGGGPGAEHLERLMREKNLDGIAPVTQEYAQTFFERISRDTSQYETWRGELYLERHQGTYTTQAHTKRYNRKVELALRELEFWSSVAGLNASFRHPARETEAIWKEFLLYQFHDILPGSSITRVYKEAEERYAKMLGQTETFTAKADTALQRKIDTSGMQKPCVVNNSLSWERQEWLRVGRKWANVRVPAMGYTTVDLAERAEPAPKGKAETNLLENDLLRVRFNREGLIQSIYDKENRREVMADGVVGNALTLYNDADGDAWDIQIYYDKKKTSTFELDSTKARVDGPRAVLEQVRTYGKSRLTQEIVLTAGSRRIDFVTRVDWRESNKMLRASFPVAVRTNEVTCNIQFGQIKRPTHRNTSWDMAKYEICAQKWIDMSQTDYGVALLNESKYGHRAHDNVLDIDLLRSPGWPDAKADRGRQEFTYSLYPHAGGFVESQVMRAGYELNVPLRASAVKPSSGTLPSEHSFVQVDAENVLVETVKPAEDGDGLIVRLYETDGADAAACIRFAFGDEPKAVQLVDMMEEGGKNLKRNKKGVQLQFAPHEIHTLRVTFA